MSIKSINQNESWVDRTYRKLQANYYRFKNEYDYITLYKNLLNAAIFEGLPALEQEIKSALDELSPQK